MARFGPLILVAALVVLAAPGAAWANSCCAGVAASPSDNDASGPAGPAGMGGLDASEGGRGARSHTIRALDDCCQCTRECPCDSGCEDCGCPGCGTASAPGSPGVLSAGAGSWPASGGGEMALEPDERVTALDGAGGLLRPPIL